MTVVSDRGGTPTLTKVLNRRGWASAPTRRRHAATRPARIQRAHAHRTTDSRAWSSVRRQLLQANGGGALANVPSGGRLMMPYEPQILVLFRESRSRCRSAWMRLRHATPNRRIIPLT